MPSVGWCDCLLGARKAHKETSAHDYQGWLQARPIKEDRKTYFDLVLFSKNLKTLTSKTLEKMKKGTWKFVLQTIASILTAIATTLGVTSCMGY